MFLWLKANFATIAVSVVLLVVVVLIVRKMIRDKKAGRHLCGGDCSSCGGACGGCAMQKQCHKP